MAGMSSAVNGGTASGNKGLSLAKQKEMAAQLERLQNVAAKGKAALAEAKALAEANGAHVAGQLVSFAEVQAAAGGSSLVHGYLAGGKHAGTYRILRGVSALALTGLGTYRAFTVGKGQHAMSVGSGLVAAEVSFSAFNFGQKWRAKRGASPEGQVNAGSPGAQAGSPAAPTVVITPPSQAQVSGPVREVYPDDPALVAFRARGRALHARR